MNTMNTFKTTKDTKTMKTAFGVSNVPTGTSDQRIQAIKDYCLEVTLDRKKGVLVTVNQDKLDILLPDTTWRSNQHHPDKAVRLALRYPYRWMAHSKSPKRCQAIYLAIVGCMTDAHPTIDTLLREIEIAKDEKYAEACDESLKGQIARDKEFNSRFKLVSNDNNDNDYVGV